ncbi:MAG: hypothetical protein WBB74_10425 [Gaiellaceae bacterium]
MSASETMRQFALALLEAVDEDGDVGAMTRHLDEKSDVLDRDAMLAISTVALTFLALTAGVNLRTAAESIWQAAG